ncbi:SDR family oxidoreductase [Polyangium aurulentum]|uniref:SDR family oxidoreductase n=1 Tax=Polyangium aurulentum TaxID=2567896 RepID=UPI0010AEBFC1|nr:SDR family oxidoreductase [Polyangium aurulentum]UQA60973.1 SDR family oxidoreductase [Polyangium aurulentum]
MPEPLILVTGATDGIGRQTALELLRRGARVLVHGRNAEKASATCEALRRQTASDRVEVEHADLSSMAEVRALADRVLARHEKIDVLLNNAGVFLHERHLTAEGHETTFAVNHLAPFLLTHLLLPALERSDAARIVTVSSIAHNRGQIDFNDLTSSRYYHGYTAYASSKLANILFAYELSRRLRGTKITSNVLHPGVITTKLLRTGFGTGGGTLEQGAATSVRLATDPSLAQVTGKYFADEREAKSSALSHDRALQRRLYDVSAQLTGVAPLPPVD